jgi:hypothetical protein
MSDGSDLRREDGRCVRAATSTDRVRPAPGAFMAAICRRPSELAMAQGNHFPPPGRGTF